MEKPYKDLGDKLKAARIDRQRTIAETSGAVELHEDVLRSIELGQDRPEEDILMVLISYLSINEDEAGQLWELAGYNDKDISTDVQVQADANQALAMIMPNDLRVVYTDMVHVMVNDFGVIMNFMQTTGVNNQPLAVSRIGMSKEHARSVIEILQKSLAQSNKKQPPKAIGDSTKSASSAKDNSDHKQN